MSTESRCMELKMDICAGDFAALFIFRLQGDSRRRELPSALFAVSVATTCNFQGSAGRACFARWLNSTGDAPRPDAAL